MAKNDVERDALGNIDIDFYLDAARKERSDYLAELGSALVAKIKNAFRIVPSTLSASH